MNRPMNRPLVTVNQRYNDLRHLIIAEPRICTSNHYRRREISLRRLHPTLFSNTVSAAFRGHADATAESGGVCGAEDNPLDSAG